MIGEELGSYRIVGPLGRGGMASVFVGEHLVLGHRVAIKVLSDLHLHNPTSKKRFLNEARAVARVRHPSIVELHDFGYGPDDIAYMVMELLEGEDLRTRLRKGELPEEHITTFGGQIAGALAMAHEHGIIHRDLKPSNIFLVADAETEIGERAKILDFGIAKQMPSSERKSEDLTATGVLIGTPAYMSPEQCEGGELDARSDIYSLGVVLYRMATGQLPFEGAGSDDPILMHIIGNAPPAAEIRPELSASIDALIARCLARNPDERFQSMTELGEALAAAARDSRAPDADEPAEDDTIRLELRDQVAIPMTAGDAIPAHDEAPTSVLVTPAPVTEPVVDMDELVDTVASAPPVRVQGRLTRSRLFLGLVIGVALAVGLAAWIASGGDELAETSAEPAAVEASAMTLDAAAAVSVPRADASAAPAPVQGVETLMHRAEDAYVAGDFSAALEACERVLRLEPDHQRAAVICAVSSCERGDLDRARDYSERIRSSMDAAAVTAICEDIEVKRGTREPSSHAGRPPESPAPRNKNTGGKRGRDKPRPNKRPSTFDDVEVPVLD